MLKLFTKTFQKSQNNFIQIQKRYSSVDDEIASRVFEKTRGPLQLKLYPKAKYGGESLVTLITGNSSGILCADIIKKIFLHIKAPITFEHICTGDCGEKYEKFDIVNVNEVILSLRRNRLALNFDIIHEKEKKSEGNLINNELDLFVTVMKFFPFEGFQSKFSNYNIVILCDNLLGDNVKLEYEPVKGMIETLRICSGKTIEICINYAFKYARDNERKNITFVHKIDKFPLSEGYLLKIIKNISKLYSNINYNVMEVNDVARLLVKNPNKFDVICANDRYGTTLSTICSAISGGPGLYCASNIGEHYAVFQPLQNRLSIPFEDHDFTPYGVISTGVELLLHMNLHEHSSILWNALMKTMLDDKYLTKKYGGDKSENDIVDRVIYNIN